MTVISNQAGCGDYSVTGWLTEIIQTGKDIREDLHDLGDGIEDVGKDIIGPIRDGGVELAGGVDDAVEKLGDTELFDPDAIKDAVVGNGEGILADAVNAAIGTLPTTLDEAGVKDALVGAKSGGEIIEKVAGDATDAFAKKAAEGVEEAVDEALPAGFDFELRGGWRDWTKIFIQAVLKFEYNVCDPRDLEIGGEPFTLNPFTVYVHAGGGWSYHSGWNVEGAIGGKTELIHDDSGIGTFVGYEQTLDGVTQVTGGLSYSF